MRRIRYNVAASLDGFITDADGRYDWIPDDPTVDFAGLFANVDTILVGRKTYDVALATGGLPLGPDSRVYVVSRSLQADDHPNVTVATDAVAVARSLREESGTGEIWLFGGGELFATLVAAGLVDAVEVTIVPVLLGAGTPLVASGIPRVPMTLTHSQVYPSGMVALHYSTGSVTAAAE